MNTISSNIAILLVMAVLWPVLQSGDISKLCSEDQPISAAVKYMGTNFIIKGTNVWRYSQQYTNAKGIDGPRPLKDVFESQDLDGIDAIFHINANDKFKGGQNYRRMLSLAIVFRKSNYYVFHVGVDNAYHKYRYHQHSEGLPFNLSAGTGPISSFKEADKRPVDAALFDRSKSEALIIADKDVYVLSGFEKFTNQSKKPVKKKFNDVFKIGVNVPKLEAAMDLNDKGSVQLIFDTKFCQINLSDTNPVCRLRSIKDDWFKCQDNVRSTTDQSNSVGVSEEVTDAVNNTDDLNQSQNITSNPISGNTTLVNLTITTKITNSTTKPTAKNNSTLVIVGVLVLALVIIVVIVAVFVCCVSKAMKGKNKDNSKAKEGSAKGVPIKTSAVKTPESTFSKAFAAKPHSKTSRSE